MGGLEGITVQEILALLVPSSLWDYLLYIILLFALITLFMQPEGSIGVTIIMAIVVVGIFIDKVHAFPGHRCNFGTLLVRITYFVAPLITAGISKNPKSRMPAVITAVLGLGYTFLLWAMEMNNRNVCMPLDRDLTMFIDYIEALFIV
jgi:hypothetical protein